jgi:hypothetical protein
VTNPVKLVGREADPVSLAETELKGGNREPAPAEAANNDSVKVARIPADLARMETDGKGLTVGAVLEKGVKAVNAEAGVESAAPSKAWKEIPLPSPPQEGR